MILDLPDLRQHDDFACGVVCCRVVLAYWGKRLRQSHLMDCLGTTPLDGTDPRMLETVLRVRCGCRVMAGDMAIDDLREQPRLWRPVIALVTLDGCGHYVVVAGVERGRVHFQDPMSGPVAMKIADFANHWKAEGLFRDSFRSWGLAAWR